jgi:hypothetical protein
VDPPPGPDDDGAAAEPAAGPGALTGVDFAGLGLAAVDAAAPVLAEPGFAALGFTGVAVFCAPVPCGVAFGAAVVAGAGTGPFGRRTTLAFPVPVGETLSTCVLTARAAEPAASIPATDRTRAAPVFMAPL